MLKQHMDFHASSDHEIQPCIHYMETSSSILHEMPWIQQQKHKVCNVCCRLRSECVIKEFRCYEAKIEESEKAGSRWESNPGHLWLEPPVLCH